MLLKWQKRQPPTASQSVQRPLRRPPRDTVRYGIVRYMRTIAACCGARRAARGVRGDRARSRAPAHGASRHHHRSGLD